MSNIDNPAKTSRPRRAGTRKQQIAQRGPSAERFFARSTNPEPLVRLIEVQAPPPSLQDNTGDLDRLLRALTPELPGPVRVPFPLLGRVASRFRQAGFKGVAVINDLASGPELADFLPAPPAVLPLMALDLGTTHLEASLVDGLSGAILARGHRENAQGSHGADILSRIHFAAGEGGLQTLQRDVIGSIDRLAAGLAAEAGLAATDFRALSVSGNTTMIHFFLGLDPYHLIREPYIPLVNAPAPCRAAELGLGLHPAAAVWIMPGIGSYFGGDLVSGIIATGLDEQEETSMLIDVGTNAEVVVGNREWLIACAGAAGPALEGGVARMGMRAGPGAIEHVTIDPDTGEPSWTTIGGAPPRGICGSGMIDLVAGLYLARIIDLRGKFRRERLAGRLIETPEGLTYVVADEAAAAGRPVMLHQTDLDALMRSKAAMYAILTTLVGQVGLGFEELHRIYVAGAFGRHIAPRQAIILGMLPDLPLDTYQPVGNSSLAGAELVLLERRARERCLEVTRRITYIELNVNQEFMTRFSGSRFIPHTDPRLFPSVPVFEG